MTAETRRLFEQFLALPPAEREEFVAEACAALDVEPAEDPAAVEAAWEAEIARRIAEADSGLVPSVPWEEVDRILTEKLDAARVKA
jgi:putative addiction module component (TIGR02574 family)